MREIKNKPIEWFEGKLSEIVDLLHGYQFRSFDFTKDGIPVIKIGNVIGSKLNLNDTDFISENRYNEFKNFEIKNGDILMSLTGNIGRVIEVKNLSGKVLQNYRVGKFVPVNQKELYKPYIKFLLSSDYVLNQFFKFSNQSAQANFGKHDMDKISVVIPKSLPEQQKIAEILSTVDEKIEVIEAQINQTTELKKGLMQQLLTKGIGHTKFKDSPLGKIPESWEVVKLEKYCDVRDGTHDSPKYLKEGIPFITSKNLSGNNLDFSDVKYISHEDHLNFSKRSFVDDGDILFAMIGTVGNPIVVKKEFEFSIKNVALLKFKKKQLINTFALNVLRSKIVENQFQKISNGGVLKFVALGNIRNLNFPIPPTHEQQQIATILNTIDDKIVSLVAKKTQYINFKKGLMQQLLTGKLRVNLNPTNHAAKSGELQAAE